MTINWFQVGIGLSIGLFLWLANGFIFPLIGLALWQNFFEGLGEGLLVVALIAVPWFLTKRFDKVTAVVATLAILAGYSLVPSFWTFVTSRSFVAEVVYAGTDEDRSGARTTFIVDLRTDDGELTEARARDVFYPPFYWHLWSGDTRGELRAAQHDKRPVCVTLTGVRVPFYFPNVLAVNNAEDC